MADEEKKDLNNAQSEPQTVQPGSDADDALKACEAERDEYLAGWKRAAADLSNYKKEEGKRLEEFSSWSIAKIVKDLLPVLDSFDLGLKASSSGNDEDGKKGISLIKNQLEDALKKQGVERISVSAGDELDTRIHEAVAEVDIAEQSEHSGKIVEELAAGYRLNGKVIRAAKVAVGK